MPSRAARLPDEVLATLANVGTRRRFRPGQEICRQGDPANSLQVVLSGRATVGLVSPTGEPLTTAVLGPGEVFGEGALLDGQAVHSASLVASEAVEILAVGADGLGELQAKDPALASALSKVLASRVQSLTNSLVEAFQLPAANRVLRRLAALSSTYGEGSANTIVPIDQSELAAMAGVSRATANRALRREETAGILRLGRGRITVIDPARLAAAVGATEPAVPPEQETEAPAEGEERRVVAVLCVELFRDDTAPPDPEDFRRDLAFRSNRIRAIVEDNGGRIDEIVGGRIIAVFGVPAHGDDVGNALRAANMIISNAEVGGERLRVGVEVGQSLVRQTSQGGFSLVGDAVDIAQALATNATAGTVALGQEAHRARVERPLLTSPMLGRDEEYDLLCRLWRRVVSERRPWLETVVGPPGIGKTRLGLELAATVEADGGLVLRGRSLPYVERTGYSAFGDQIRRAAGIADTDSADAARSKLAACVDQVVPEGEAKSVLRDLGLILGSEQSAPADRQALFLSARRFVAGLGRKQPTLLVFEDVHWAEATLLDLVLWLGSRLADSAVLILGLTRPELLDSRSDWAGGLTNASTIELDVLSEKSSERLARRLLGAGVTSVVRKRLLEFSGGNPLFIEELAAAAGEHVKNEAGRLPTTLVTTIMARLDALPVPTRDVVLDAAVVGKTFWKGALSHTRRHPNLDELLDQLELKGFVRKQPTSTLPADQEYQFKHVVIRQVAYETIPRTLRRRAHGRVARWLERTFGQRAGEPASVLAHHWLEAGEPDRALRYLISASDRAARAAAHREAAASLSEALSLAESRSDAALIADLHGRRGTQLARIGDWPSARRDLELAVARLPASNVDQRVRLLDELSMICHWLMDAKSLRAHANEAYEVAEKAGRDDLMAGAVGLLGWADSSDGDVESSMRRLEAGLKHPSGIPSELLAPTAELAGLTLYWIGHVNEAVKRAEQALEISRAATNTNTTIRALGNLILALAAVGRYDDAAETFARAREFGEEFGTGGFLARAVAMYGGVRLELDDFDGAERLAREAAQLARNHHFQLPVVSTGIDLMINYARRGEPERAERLAPEVERAVRPALGAHGWLWRLRFAAATAEIAVARENWEEARRTAEEALTRAKATHRMKYQIRAEGILALVGAADGRADDARTLSGSAVRLARSMGDPAVLSRALELERAVTEGVSGRTG
jgi:CRP-like cAMP-binding protein/tetratricopeptide (TPR) repeat protein